jgi:uncharacterized membrane protein YhhN
MRTSLPPRALRAFIPYGIVGLVHVGALLMGETSTAAGIVAAVTKPLLMPALLFALSVTVPIRSRVFLLATLAIVFSWVGDVVLAVPGPTMFLLGLIAFLAAHLVYIPLLWKHLAVRRLPLAAFAYVGWWIALLALLAPHVGWMVWPLAIYGIVLGAMAAAATRGAGVVVFGGLLFLVSDSILAIRRFIADAEIWQSDFVVMVTYVAAQGFIILGVVMHSQRKAQQRFTDAESPSTGVVPVIRTEANL